MDKTVFKGEFKNGVLEGQVTIEYANGDKVIDLIIIMFKSTLAV